MIRGPEHLTGVGTYTPGESAEQIRHRYGLANVEKLASNENPLGPSTLAAEAASKAIRTLHRYGDGGAALRTALAQHHGCSAECIVVHNGSDALIHHIMRTFLLPGDTALSCEGGFVSFEIAVKAVGKVPHYVPLAPGYRFDVEALASAVTPNTKVLYIPNPNNPTGTHITTAELEWLVNNVPASVLIVVDEAYFEYAVAQAPTTYPDSTKLNRKNLVTLRTFSKAYGLAALRIGYAIGSPDVIQWLLKTVLPFDPNAVGCAAAIAALQDSQHIRKTVETAQQGMVLVRDALEGCGYRTSDSVANFVFVDCGSSQLAEKFYMMLLHKGFITRRLTAFGHPGAVRITLGTPEQNIQLATVLTEQSELFVES